MKKVTKKQITEQTVTINRPTSSAYGSYQFKYNGLMYNNWMLNSNTITINPVDEYDTPLITKKSKEGTKYSAKTKKEFVDAVYEIINKKNYKTLR